MIGLAASSGQLALRDELRERRQRRRKVVEGVGGGIMVIGGLIVFARFAQQVTAHASDPFRQLRANLGRVILRDLEVLIIADIIRTIVVDHSPESVGVLGLIVLIRIVLSFSVLLGFLWVV